MRKSIEEVRYLLRAKTDCIWIQSYEEKAVIDDLKELIKSEPRFRDGNIMLWSQTEGLSKIPKNDYEQAEPADQKMREWLVVGEKVRQCQKGTKEGSMNFWILRDLHQKIDDPRSQRLIRDLKEHTIASDNYNPLIVVSPNISLPDDIARLFRVVEYELPNRALIEGYVRAINNLLITSKKKNPDADFEPILKDEEFEPIISACMGLTEKEIDMVLKESATKFHALNLEYISQSKIQVVKKTGVLDYVIPKVKMEDVGGNDEIKNWLLEIKAAFSPEAREFGLPMPKGYMATGIAGAGKTLLAEAFAGEMGYPLLDFSMDRVMDKLVGNSEKKIAHALRIAESCAPCVLLIDEVEKILGRRESSLVA